VARKQPVDAGERPSEHEDEQSAADGHDQNGHDDEPANYEKELAQYLQQRIKPGLNSSAIPLMARSIAKEIAHRKPPTDEAEGMDGEDPGNDAPADFEADMRELQAELGDDWVLRFSVHGDDGWLTAEKADGSQRLEAPNAQVLTDAVQALNGDRSG
jgi:hypothetical protein